MVEGVWKAYRKAEPPHRFTELCLNPPLAAGDLGVLLVVRQSGKDGVTYGMAAKLHAGAAHLPNHVPSHPHPMCMLLRTAPRSGRFTEELEERARAIRGQ